MAARHIYEPNGKSASPAPKDAATNGDGAANGASGAVAALEAAQKEPVQVVRCNECGVDCTRVHYHYVESDPAKAKDMAFPDVCPRCYMDKHYSQSWTTSKFVKTENPEYSVAPEPEVKWTNEEVLRLLEALETHDDDWNQVAAEVGSKTREQCVMKFLQLEIEDKYAEPEVPQQGAVSESQGFLRDLTFLTEGRLPFHNADSPVLSVISFLAGLAPPSVITEAASARSAAEMRKVLAKNQEKIGPAPTSDKGKEKAASTDASDVKNEDAMEVDAVQPTSTVVATTTSEPTDSNPLLTLPFALSAARSSALASHEERHVSRLVSGAVNLQLQKLQLKIAHFNDFEKLLSAERRDLQRRRQQLFMDRLAFQRRVRSLEEATKKISQNLGGQGLPGAINPEDAVNALTEAIRTFGIGKGDDSVGVKRSSIDGSVQPLGDGAEGFGSIEV